MGLRGGGGSRRKTIADNGMCLKNKGSLHILPFCPGFSFQAWKSALLHCRASEVGFLLKTRLILQHIYKKEASLRDDLSFNLSFPALSRIASIPPGRRATSAARSSYLGNTQKPGENSEGGENQSGETAATRQDDGGEGKCVE